MQNGDSMTLTIQRAALEVLKEFQRICKKHNLSYYAIGGTCIGAVRHKGFIPWDDDIDVAMPYDDYQQFLRLPKEEFKNGFSIIGPYSCQHYAYIFSKLQNEETTFVENQDVKYKDRYSGIYIDIFPIYGLPKQKSRIWIIERYTFVQKKINLRMRYDLNYDSGLVWKISWILCAPLRKLFKYDHFCIQLEKKLASIRYDSSELIFFCWRAIPRKGSNKTYKNIFYREDFSNMLEVPFEDTTIMVPNGYNRYLEMDFGDYMKLPPKEQQITRHPKAIIDLKQSYKKYQK